MATQDVLAILASKDLESPQFDPISFINDLLPNEQALSDIDVVLAKVQTSMQRLDEDIKKDIRYYSTQRTKATNAFKASQVSIVELFSKIHEIKAKAEQSESMVQEICKDIKILDHAKVHITASIKTLRRLQMLVSAVDQLRSHSTARQYRDVGNLLEAINQLSPGFSEFKTIPKIKDLNAEIALFRKSLAEQSREEFRKYDAQINQSLNGTGTIGPSLLRDVCFVVSALGPTAKNDFITWFVEDQLQDYKTSFPENSEISNLHHVDTRYAWLIRELRYFEENYSKIFPIDWKMHVKIAMEFCISTRLDIAAQLENSKDNIDVPGLVMALKKTVEFEKDICSKLQEYVRPKNAKQEEEEVHVVETGYLDDEPTDGFHLKFSAEAIKKKWENHLQQKEKEKEKIAQKIKIIPVAEELVHQFIGVISTCFDPYMDHYIREEDKNMKLLLEKIIAEETWITPVSANNKVLLSSADLIYYFNEARKKCAPLTKGQPLFDLFLLFKKYLNVYATILHNKIEEHPISSHPKPLSETGELSTIMIINTAEYCAATTTQIAETISRLIEEKFKPRIDLTSEHEAFSSVTSRGLKSLAHHMEGKMDSALTSMAKIKWGEVQQVEEQSNYASQIGEVLKSTLPRFKLSLSAPHFNYLCDVFVTSFVSRGIIQNLYKCKFISNDGAHQLLLDIATIKDALLHVVGQPPPTRFAKLVNKEIGRVEAILKLLTMPNDAIVKGYYTMIPDGSDTDLHKILALKGMNKDERKELLQRHLNPPTSNAARSASPNHSLLSTSSHPDSPPQLVSRNSSASPSPPSTNSPPSPSIPSFFSSAPSHASVVMPAALKASLKNFLPDFDWRK